MRILVLAILAIGTVWAAEPARAQTYDPRFPVCMHVYGDPTYYECNFGSLASCAASASARPAQCIVNPYYANAGVPVGPRHRRHRNYY
jgi:Protein of unknown function (DUF3551)